MLFNSSNLNVTLFNSEAKVILTAVLGQRSCFGGGSKVCESGTDAAAEASMVK